MGLEVQRMTAQHSVKLVPWDDQEFVRAYERACAEMAAMGVSLDQPNAPVEIQRRLRVDGYPNAVCFCERTVDLALARQSRCVVMRDGETATLLQH
jgi:hypothetical protein